MRLNKSHFFIDEDNRGIFNGVKSIDLFVQINFVVSMFFLLNMQTYKRMISSDSIFISY